MGKKSKSTSSQEMKPAKEVMPHLTGFLDAAESQYNRGPAEFFPGQTYVDTTQGHQLAMDRYGDLASGMPGYHGAATNHLSNLLQGPGQADIDDQISKAISKATRSVTPGLNASWHLGGGMGATESPLFADAAATATGHVVTDYMDNYLQRQEARQDGALSMVPGYLGLESMPANYAMQLGNMQEAEAMKPLQDAMARHNYEATADQNHLNQWGQQLGAIAPLMGGTNISTQTKPGGGLLSSIAGIASMAMPFMMPGMGAGMGAAMGVGNMGMGNHNGFPIGGAFSPWSWGKTAPWT